MSRRTFTNAVLLVAAVALGVFIVNMPHESEEAAHAPLSHEEPASVSRIRLEPGDGAAMELRRSDGRWHLVEPMRIAANDFRVGALLRVLQAPVHARIDATRDQLGRFGLAAPQARLLLDDREILFGDTDPINGRRYLLFDGRVALIDDAYFSHLRSSAANYADPRLIAQQAGLRAIALPGLSVYRDGGAWHSTPAAEGLDGLIAAWREAQATAVRPYEPSLPWSEVIEVVLEDGGVRFEVARTEYELILGRSDLGIQYHLTKAAGARLMGSEPQARARRPTRARHMAHASAASSSSDPLRRLPA